SPVSHVEAGLLRVDVRRMGDLRRAAFRRSSVLWADPPSASPTSAMADQTPPRGTPQAGGTPQDGGTGPRMESDLRAVREAYNVSLETLEYETRMPPDILRRFEAGELVGDPHYNEVYLRNLLKSYAKSLGISHQEVEKAYEAAKAGAYDGSLRRLYLEGGAPSDTEAPASGGTAPAVAALGARPPKPPTPAAPPPKETSRPNEHFPKQRV